MVREGTARPVIIPRKKGLTEDIVLGIVRTLGLTKKEFLEHLEAKKAKKSKPKQTKADAD